MNSPTMYYAVDTIGGYEGMFDGENVLLSAGLAWNNPGDGFSLHVPENPDTLFVDSGGFQATARWGLQYPYTPADYFEWADEIGADYVALPDYACEPELHESDPMDRVRRTLMAHCRAMRAYHDGDYGFTPVPVLQGWDPTDYRQCAEWFDAHDLVGDRMAIGTVCKRSDTGMIRTVLDTVESVLGMREWHLFGLTLNGWKDRQLWGRFATSDTAAWNWGAEDKAHKKRLYREYASKVEEYRQAIAQQDTLT